MAAIKSKTRNQTALDAGVVIVVFGAFLILSLIVFR